MIKAVAICGGILGVAIAGVFVANAVVESTRGYGFISLP